MNRHIDGRQRMLGRGGEGGGGGGGEGEGSKSCVKDIFLMVELPVPTISILHGTFMWCDVQWFVFMLEYFCKQWSTVCM